MNIITGITLAVSFFGVIFKTTKDGIVFYEDIFVKRYVNRLNALPESTDTESIAYIKLLKETECFRIASGITTSPEKAIMLRKIYLLGRITRSDLKELSRYLDASNGKILITVGLADKVLFAYSFLSGCFLTLCVYYYLIIAGYSAFTTNWMNSIVNIIIAFTVALFVKSIRKDHRIYLLLKKEKERLTELDMIKNPEDPIQWDFFDKLCAGGGTKK